MAVTVFKMPRLSMTMIEGVVVRWLAEENEEVEKGKPLLEIETDKSVMTVTSPIDGFIKKIIAKPMDVVHVDNDLCIIAETNNEAIADFQKVDEKIIETQTKIITSEITKDNENSNVEKLRISPLAKRIANEGNINYSNLKGTGPDGVIVKKDILNYINSSEQTVLLAEQEEREMKGFSEQIIEQRIPFVGIRKLTAKRMAESSNTTAAVTTFADVDMTAVKVYRKYIPVSYTTYVIKATIKAINEYKIMNAQLKEDSIVILKDININVAVGTGKSLVTPVIKNADQKNILSISEEILKHSDNAKNNKLTAEDLEGGTFTVTNSGVFGSYFFTPIINFPQCAILGMGKLQETPVVRDDQVAIAPIMILCLTYDHRIVDGETSVKFLQRIKYYLEHPEELISSKKKED